MQTENLSAAQLQERRDELAAEIRRLGANPGEWRAEDRQRWAEVNNEYNAVYAALQEAVTREEAAAQERETVVDVLEQLERHERPGIEASIGRERSPGIGGGRRPMIERTGMTNQMAAYQALQAWCLHGRTEPTRQQQLALREVGLNPLMPVIEPDMLMASAFVADLQECWAFNHASGASRAARRAIPDIRAAMETGDQGEGGTWIAEGFINRLEVSQLAFGGMLQVAEILRTAKGEDLPWPTADDTGNTGEILAEEAAAHTEAQPTTGAMTLGAFWFSSKLIKVSIQLLDDSAINAGNMLAGMLGTRLGRVQNTYYTTGAGGAGEPNGIVTAASVGVTAASATAFTYEELLALEHSVDPSYRNQEGAGYMSHDNVVLELRKLKDGNGQYIWTNGAQMNQPDRVHGYKHTVNQDMASAMTTGQKVLTFGALRKYKVRQVKSIRFMRLNELFAANNQVGFIAFMRADGDLLDAGVDPVKVLQLG